MSVLDQARQAAADDLALAIWSEQRSLIRDDLDSAANAALVVLLEHLEAEAGKPLMANREFVLKLRQLLEEVRGDE